MGRLTDETAMQLRCEQMDLTCEFGVGLQFQLLGLEVMVCLCLLESRLPILTDHHERRKEDCLERHDQRQRWPRAFLQNQHPDSEHRRVNPDEVHRPRECRDSIGQPHLETLASFLCLVQYGRMMQWLATQRPTRD